MDHGHKTSVKNPPALYSHSTKQSLYSKLGHSPFQKKIGWFGIACIAIGGCTNSLFLMGLLVPGTDNFVIGTIAVPLFIVGVIVSLLAIPAWLKLTLLFPNHVGGVAAACSEIFRPYSKLLANLAGICYWLGRIPLCSLAACMCAYFIHLYYLPSVSIHIIGTIIILTAAFINLQGIHFVARIAIPIAIISSMVAILAGILPIFSDTMSWNQAIDFHIASNDTYEHFIGYAAALCLIGMGTSALEQATCYAGETINPEKNIPRAVYIVAGMTCVYFILIPVVWLGMFGSNLAMQGIPEIINSALVPIFGTFVKTMTVWFLMIILFHTTITIMASVPRTLMQLADNALVPQIFSKRTVTDAPITATFLTAIIAIAFLLASTPICLFVAGAVTYLVSICFPLVAVLFLRKQQAELYGPYDPHPVINALCVLITCFWAVVILLGFQRFGFDAILTAMFFVYTGAILYSLRKARDRADIGLSPFNALPVKLTVFSILILLLNATAFHTAIEQVGPQKAVFINLYTEIFLVAAIITYSVAMIVPNILANSALQVAKSAKKLSKGTLADFSNAMIALGKGDLDAAHASISMNPIPVYSRDDEISEMAISFNELQMGIIQAASGLDAARVGLMDARNKLIDTNVTLSIKERALREMNETLEERVRDRTQELEQTQQQLLTTAHLAGMAEVATNVLHNVGNILNTINVSAGLISEKVVHSELHSALKNINTIFSEHKNDLGKFITKDPRGMMLPEYIDALYIQWKKEYTDISTELGSLTHNIEHIRDIITTQQLLSGISGFEQIINVQELIEEALKITELDKGQNGISIKKEYVALEPIITDKIKMLQILINLIRNAKDALLESPRKDKELTLRLTRPDPGKFIIEVIDNGIGINPENMKYIFTHGFTTKVQGHGFGLHSCALAAKEMDGDLRFHTEGPGEGATFILELPYKVSADSTAPEKENIQ